ncbi:response regulator [Roseomonas sp. E05]|uniref:response regulator transcription factor n=1 Tax=Roseomonas sp. E05 TaxID=3046310 RepID=UPI0024B91C16|nr:response regulator [Roseomonas sp. E05]MDJ0388739.1 response regulator [Roseomonas sp. E05]
MTKSGDPPLVLIVDDDNAVRQALDSLLRSVGYRVRAFSSADDLLGSGLAAEGNCLILDIRLPVVSGLDLQLRLAGEDLQVPVIFMTGHGDIPMTVRAMKAGAIDFLPKPFREQEMLDAVGAAIEHDRSRRADAAAQADLRARFDSLSPREREIMTLATSGLMNKQIATRLGLSEITVKIHRGKAMQKMAARSFANLVQMAEILGLHAR